MTRHRPQAVRYGCSKARPGQKRSRPSSAAPGTPLSWHLGPSSLFMPGPSTTVRRWASPMTRSSSGTRCSSRVSSRSVTKNHHPRLGLLGHDQKTHSRLKHELLSRLSLEKKPTIYSSLVLVLVFWSFPLGLFSVQTAQITRRHYKMPI